jgi:hypothetical protein
MPNFLQGDIFPTAINKDQLILVFGHIGFNEMTKTWNAFRDRVPAFANIPDPFRDRPGPRQINPDQWIWFVREQENHGMTDDMLGGVVRTVFDWAQSMNLSTVITNGIEDVGQGPDVQANQENEDRRADFLARLANYYERPPLNFRITLISLDDVFIRARGRYENDEPPEDDDPWSEEEPFP